MEAEGFVGLKDPSGDLPDVLLCVPNSPFVKPIFWPPYQGQGIVLQLSVDDIDTEHRRLQNAAAPFVLNLVDEPFNGRHFTLQEPAGMLIDISWGANF